ncbi:hypothetical protein [Pusillimonas noertemannii]|uniref:hypothetical protein n=1 Tax=Pusillimonas noertemannii TaxID=305977 RepID=UPI003341909A
MAYLYFVTLNTGRHENIILPDTRHADNAAFDLSSALINGRAAISSHKGYEISAMTIGPTLVYTIYRGTELPLATVGVAARSRGSANLWRMLHETARYPLATSPDRPPAEPWCAVRAEPSMMTDAQSPWTWLATYEVEIAAAWINKRHLDA